MSKLFLFYWLLSYMCMQDLIVTESPRTWSHTVSKQKTKLTLSPNYFHTVVRLTDHVGNRNYLRKHSGTQISQKLSYAVRPFTGCSRNSLSFMMNSPQSKSLVMFTGQVTHLFRRFPMKSCSPMSAKTLRQKTVRIITSDSFFTDWIRAPTMVFRPVS